MYTSDSSALSYRLFLWVFVCNLISPSFPWVDLFRTTKHVEYNASLCVYSLPGMLVRCRREGEVSSFSFMRSTTVVSASARK